MRCLVLVIIVIVLFAPHSDAQPGRPEIFGFALPYPKELPHIERPDQKLRFNDLTYIPLILQIDKNGCISEIIPESEQDTSIVRLCEWYLEFLDFEPATLNGEIVEAKIPIQLIFRYKVYYPKYVFPVGSDFEDINFELFEKAYQMNGIEFAGLKKFPSFSGYLDKNDTSFYFPYILLKIGLDSCGSLVDVGIIRSTFPSFNMQLSSAALWAEYSPARVKKKAVPSEPFLLISFFPKLNFPTKPWINGQFDELTLIEQATVRMIPDTVGLMFLPIPRRSPAEMFTLTGENQKIDDEVNFSIRIDTLGNCYFRPERKISKEIKAIVKRIEKKLKFYPALGYDGRVRQFIDFVTVKFNNSTTVRVGYHWLKFQ